MEHPVIWREGLFLRPQHLQQQDRHWQSLHRRHMQTHFPFGYGLLHCTFSEQHLHAGQLQLTRLEACFPDGQWCLAPQRDALPAALSADSHHEAGALIYITLPMPASRLSIHRPILDCEDKHAMAAELELSQLRPVLTWQDCGADNERRLPIARLKTRHPDGRLELDEHYLPCAMILAASPALQQVAQGLYLTMQARAAQRSAALPTHRQPTLSLLQACSLQRGLSQLGALLAHDRHTPEQLFLLLAALSAELDVLVPDTPLSDNPGYQHDDQDNAFAPLLQHLQQQLMRIGEPELRRLPQQETGPHQYQVALDEGCWRPNTRLLLALRASPTTPTQQQVEQQVKISWPSRLPDLLALQLPGLPLHSCLSPPPGWPENTACFELVLDDIGNQAIRVESALNIRITGHLALQEVALWLHHK